MNWKMKATLGACALIFVTQASAQITFYEDEGFGGRKFSVNRPLDDLWNHGFKDSASSVVVKSGRWEVCEEPGYEGHCMILRPGRYDSLSRMGLEGSIFSARKVVAGRTNNNAAPAAQRYSNSGVGQYSNPQAGHITFYESEGFRGRVFSTWQQVGNFQNVGFNDRASSVVVDGGRWEVCDDVGYSGRCMVLRPGSYESLRGMNMEGRISSVRSVEGGRNYNNEAPAPLPAPTYDYRLRPNENLQYATVTSAVAVVGPPEQRCWIEREEVQSSKDPNVGGAILGGLLGGVLGHQVGGGRGKDVATAGGAVVGALLGANAGRASTGTNVRDVQRCSDLKNTTPAYWDVTYNFRGQEHRTQLSAAPGSTIPVNSNGEPRL